MGDRAQDNEGVRGPPHRGCKERLTTGDMARLSGSTLRTVRFYEEEGLIEPVGRSGGGHRHFGPQELEKLQLALDLREAGLGLAEIKTLFELKQRAESAREASDEMSAFLSERLEDMQRKIVKLRRLRDELNAMVSVITECRECDGSHFPDGCSECDVMDQPELPRAVNVLWKE